MSNVSYAFIDRDGTIIKEPEDFQVDRLDKVEFVEGVIPALLKLQSLGYKLVMVTNQDGLGTESFPEEDFWLVQNFVMKLLLSQGIHFDRVAICPHKPEDRCECRKPKIQLLLPEIQTGKMDFEKSFVVGDRSSDLELARNLNLKSFQIGKLSWDEILQELEFGHRRYTIERKTKETQVKVTCDLNGRGEYEVSTGIGFFDHMLEQLSKHSGMNLELRCEGDLHIDEHHTVEDVGLALGECILKALGNKLNIQRYGFVLPMDESQVQVSLDLSGRPYFVFKGEYPRESVGGLSTEMVKHFFRSLSESLKANLHLSVDGDNAHHMVEASFKAVARALGQAIDDSKSQGLPSTKGVL